MMLDSLDARLLRSRADRLGFRNAGNLEKFVADFDAHAAISRSIESHVRGGLCFPFHVAGEVHRLSVDLDLYTAEAKADVVAAVPDLLMGHGFESVSTHWRHRKGMATPHLVRFKARFRSHFGATSSIFVDIACGLEAGLVETVAVPPGYGMLGMRTGHEISVLSMGSLIADKIMSLGIGTVGYMSLSSTPKQIYDIGKLIQRAGAGDLESALSTYGRLTGFKLSRDGRGHTLGEVTASIASYLDGLARPGASPGLAKHWEHFGEFSAGMLSRAQQAPDGHEERILLVLACARSLERSLGRGAPRAGEAAALRALVDGANARRAAGGHLGFLRGALGLPAA